MFSKPSHLSAAERQQYFEQLCQMDDEALWDIWKESGMQDKLKAIEERLSPAHWEQDRDTIRCSKCGFGFYPSQPWFKNGICISINNPRFRPSCCPNCGKHMIEENN